MTRPKSRYPVSSFGPALMRVLIEGSRKEIILEFPNRRSAASLQARIHSLRAAMRREDNPSHAIASRVMVSVLYGERIGKPDDPQGLKAAHLRLRPRDSEFDEVLATAGIAELPLTSDPLEEIEEEPDPMTAYLDEITPEKK